jgi:hypothetical protein
MTGRQFIDGDGVIYERDRAGDLVAVGHQPPPRPAPGALCADHGEPFGYTAGACTPCMADWRSGERPAAFIGLHFDPDDPHELHNDEPAAPTDWSKQ